MEHVDTIEESANTSPILKIHQVQNMERGKENVLKTQTLEAV